MGGRLRVGTGATASVHLLPPVLRRLQARYPAIELVVVTGNSREVAAAVAANQLDLAIVTLPVSARALAVEPLRVDPLVAIAPAGRPWRRRAPFTPAELSRHPLILYERGGTIRQVIDEWFRKAGATPRVAMELGNAEAIKKLVGAGLGLSLASAMAVAAEVKAGRPVRHPAQPAPRAPPRPHPAARQARHAGAPRRPRRPRHPQAKATALARMIGLVPHPFFSSGVGSKVGGTWSSPSSK